jgi:hypothetical protein
MRHPLRPSAAAHHSRALGALVPLLATAVLVAAASPQPSARGYFRATSQPGAELVRLELMNNPAEGEAGGAVVADVRRAELASLASEQLAPGYSGPLHFTLVRDAGRFTFDGNVHDGEADGMYAFTADARYPETLAADGYERPSAADQFRLALSGIDLQLVRHIRDLGYIRPTTSDLVRMATHGVDLEYLLSMAPVADRVRTLAKLTKLHDHGVDLAYVAELERLGYVNLSADDMMALRDHGIDSVYITELADAGYIHLPPAKLVKAREHGVTGDFARAMQRAGYDHLSLDELGKLRDHDITAAFAEQIRRVSSAGAPTADDLVRAKLRGVS